MAVAEELARAAAARAAVTRLESGMTIGLGSGRAVWRVIEEIAARWPGRPPLRVACASPVTEERAVGIGLDPVALDGSVRLDVAIDGADEVDPHLGLIKGGGGALLREKLVIAAAGRFHGVAEVDKQVTRLGERRALPVEVVRFAWPETRRRVLELVEEAQLREDAGGRPFVTDEGHCLLDCRLGAGTDAAALAVRLKQTVGVVEHGLFIGMARLALLGRGDGSLEVVEAGGARS
ncbi:MAG: ribose-5-phosphate isomerase RpiA [Thermoleophilaceae bacterium]